VCYFNLGNIVFMRRHAPRWLVTFARPSVFRLQTHAPPSSRSHQRLFLLVSSFLFTIGSCQDITPVVTELLRKSEFHLSRWDQAAAEDALRCGVGSIVSARGRNPARYCASNALRAAVTVAPIPTIPSSTLGPSSAIHSCPRTNNLGRRTADGLPG
jgi:hypothetical protein